MATYNFTKETRLYVVRNGIQQRLSIYPGPSYSQTFEETSVPVKTLHSQYDMFDNAVIAKANPANFSFTIPILLESYLNVVLELLLDYAPGEASLNTADLYVAVNSEMYKLEKAVLESGTFRITRDSLVVLNVSGSARKLSKHTGSIPGSVRGIASTQTYTPVTSMLVSIGGEEQKYITAVSVEVKNDVQWVDYSTLQNSLNISDASGTQYPEAFVVQSRTLSGTIQQYVTDETNKVNTWAIGTPMSVRVNNLGFNNWGLSVDIPAAVYTNRVEAQELVIQSYDFRMISNPAALSTVIRKI